MTPEAKPGGRPPRPAGPVRTAIVGAGNIAGPYARSLVTYPEVELLGVTDLDDARARRLADEVGVGVYDDLAGLLADDRVELVVVLAHHAAHHAITRAALEAGKHVYSEKPLALTAEHAEELVGLARDRGLRLGCSPFTFLFEPAQAAWRAIRGGELGTVRVAYAEVNWGRIERWHPDPASFYEVGALFDVGVYPLTILTAIFGPARRAWGYGRVLWPERLTKRGVPFRVEAPDFVVAVVEFEGGVVVRLTANFYVTQQGRQTGIAFHGDLGSLDLHSWHHPDARLDFAAFDEPFVPHGGFDGERMEWGRGVLELARAVLEGREHRVTGEQAAHVVEVVCAVATSIREGRPVDVRSTFPPPEPLPAPPSAVPASAGA